MAQLLTERIYKTVKLFIALFRYNYKKQPLIYRDNDLFKLKREKEQRTTKNAQIVPIQQKMVGGMGVRNVEKRIKT
jgi:hypothetical protein